MPKPLTKEEADIFVRNFPQFVEETRKNFSQLFEERSQDAKLWEDIYKEVGGLKSEVHLAVAKLLEAGNKIDNHRTLVTEAVTSSIEHLEGTLDQSDTVIVKRDFTFKDLIAKINIFRKKNAKTIT